jgi:hypothetical protein
MRRSTFDLGQLPLLSKLGLSLCTNPFFVVGMGLAKS